MRIALGVALRVHFYRNIFTMYPKQKCARSTGGAFVRKPLECVLREIRRRTRVVGAFQDGQSALNLAAAKLRHIAGTH